MKIWYGFLVLGIFCTLIADQKPIVVVIPSYNNEQWCIQNLDSVFAQKYENYRIIFIDDNSTDRTPTLVQEHIAACGQEHRVTFICNTVNRKQLANHYMAVHLCADHEIVVHLDGDDFFAHDEVLARINEAYQNPNVWMTYGQFQEWPSGQQGRCEQLSNVVIRNNMFRHAPWATSHLRTFYASLFKCIKLSDFLYDGQFFPCSADFAMMYPMLEMAGDRSVFIPEVLYLYNRQNPISYFRIAQAVTAHLEIFIRGKKKYEKITDFKRKQTLHDVDVIIISRDCQRLGSEHTILRCISGIARIDWLYEHEGKQQLFNVLSQGSSPYVLLFDESYQCACQYDVRQLIQELESAYAYAYHLDVNELNASCGPMVYIGNDTYAWQYAYCGGSLRRARKMNAIYRKSVLLQELGDMEFDSVSAFFDRWQDAYLSPDAVGLCCATA